jgi:hypothetical protein
MRKLFVLFGLLLASCISRADSSGSQATRADMIICHAAYRSDVSQPIEREDSVTFTDSDAEHSLAFTDLVFYAAYRAGEVDNERALQVQITDSNRSFVYQSHLYQFAPDSGPYNQFVGGHGFTGLNYGYHPKTSAEIQFWCEAE